MRDFTLDPITESATLRAPIVRCFALSTRVELVRLTLGMNLTDDPATPGVTSGHIAAGSRVHWRGWKFGLPTTHHTLITGFTAPIETAPGIASAWFQDSQERGRFASFQHDHFFRESTDPATGQLVTLLEDRVRFALPFGPLGRMVASLLLAPHIRSLIRQRYAILRNLAEGDGWSTWLEENHITP